MSAIASATAEVLRDPQRRNRKRTRATDLSAIASATAEVHRDPQRRNRKRTRDTEELQGY